jgi:hypothetical protein
LKKWKKKPPIFKHTNNSHLNKISTQTSREGYKPLPLGYTIFCVKNQVIILFLKGHNAMPFKPKGMLKL